MHQVICEIISFLKGSATQLAADGYGVGQLPVAAELMSFQCATATELLPLLQERVHLTVHTIFSFELNS